MTASRVAAAAALVVRRTGFLLAISLFLCTVSANAQREVGTGGNNTIQGRIYLPSGPITDVQLKVRLESTDMANLSTVTDVNGAFKFGSLEAGNYTLIVDGDQYYETFREPIIIDKQTARTGGSARIVTIPVYLRPKTGVISDTKRWTVDASLAKVPAAARELYTKGIEASKRGDTRAAVEHLKRAVDLYADFSLALTELGIQYLKLGNSADATRALKSAVKLAPNDFTSRLNYGIALLQTSEFAESEKELREAIKKNDASPVAHLYLGLVLMKLKNFDDAENELQRALASGRDEVKMAHYYLGGIYWGKRQYKQAANELEAYLRLAPNAPNAERIRGSIKELRSKE